ncbi:hypothetical protein [Spirillospora sp. NBC_01491]|nr:hypothetical protein [Spirillospora sp. NBC_01491]
MRHKTKPAPVFSGLGEVSAAVGRGIFLLHKGVLATTTHVAYQRLDR